MTTAFGEVIPHGSDNAGIVAVAAAQYAVTERVCREGRVPFDKALYHVRAVWPRNQEIPTSSAGAMDDLIKVTNKAIKRVRDSQSRKRKAQP